MTGAVRHSAGSLSPLPADIVVRPATVADVPALYEIRTGVLENHMSEEDLLDERIDRHLVERLIREDGAWVAEAGGEVLAFAMVNTDEATVFAMFVRHGWDGRGLGRRLMAEAERHLFARHARIWLTTADDPNIRAHGFYRKLGWVPAGVKDSGEQRYEKDRP